MKIDYSDMINYYLNIIKQILKELEEKLSTDEFYDELEIFLKWLKNEEEILEKMLNMDDYFDDEEFKCFALSSLHCTRKKIKGYLNDTDFKFSKEIYDINKYDDIVNERVKYERDDVKKCFEYYLNLDGQREYQNDLEFHMFILNFALDGIEKLINGEKTYGTIYHLKNKEDLSYNFNKIVEYANKLKLEYVKIEKPQLMCDK